MVRTLVCSKGSEWCDMEGARTETGEDKVLLRVLIDWGISVLGDIQNLTNMILSNLL